MRQTVDFHERLFAMDARFDLVDELNEFRLALEHQESRQALGGAVVYRVHRNISGR